MLELVYTVEFRETEGGVVYVEYIGNLWRVWTKFNNEGKVKQV